MSNAAAATDEKKFAQRLKVLSQAEKSATSAIDRANAKANVILAGARDLEAEAVAMNEDVKVIHAGAKAAQAEMTDAAKAAKEATQKANAYAKKLGKQEDKLAEKRGILERDMAEFDVARQTFDERVTKFEDSVLAMCRAAIG